MGGGDTVGGVTFGVAVVPPKGIGGGVGDVVGDVCPGLGSSGV